MDCPAFNVTLLDSLQGYRHSVQAAMEIQLFILVYSGWTVRNATPPIIGQPAIKVHTLGSRERAAAELITAARLAVTAIPKPCTQPPAQNVTIGIIPKMEVAVEKVEAVTIKLR